MAKKQTSYVCTECGADYRKWMGQCIQCGAWNTVSEFRESRAPVKSAARSGFTGQRAQLQSLEEVELVDLPRTSTLSPEFDRVLGGGIVPGSVVLIGGHPGAGKSTLLLQTTCRLAERHKILYVTGEESIQQIAMRARRLQLNSHGMQVMSETDVESVLDTAREQQPNILVIDSIQVMHMAELQSAPGSVAQVREAAAALTRYAKQSGVALLIVGHVTKDGSLAGPKVLEHMIDASIMLEGNEDSRFRTLRAIKNRFGAVNELGVFAMMETGLKDVKNPSAIFLNREGHTAAGSIVTVAWEGTRPLLVEIQALVDQGFGAAPRRLAIGSDPQRLALLLAVLHRHGGLHVGDQDVFINVVGGVKIAETSADLAVLMAISSSFKDRAAPSDWVVFGEVGLSGEIRPVSSGQERIVEAAKHGFTKAIVPKSNAPKKAPEGMQVIGVSRLQEALELL
ncbi:MULTISPECIES: DNA repair protein RadA [unclassified Hahella]|uniref:DNA repair protein RadA n=1 Tax=unclassified Hahella TaxID=2624107 RepID=UPI001C1EE032|nr:MULTISPECIES: DNA repair protein RadA [unclassified Hahella]MBU6953948.1 DNA repair protein RadA [Hahella sp. HN01]MDG9670360.1 DNA repair protein RadA [Hahella sp. CR1]